MVPISPLELYVCDCGETRYVLPADVGPFPCLACESYETVEVASELDGDAFDSLLSRAGRNHEPALLWLAYERGVIRDEIAARHVGPAWCAVEYPDRELPWDQWAKLFTLAGYTVDGEPQERPAHPMRLYRAAPEPDRSGHSWSESRTVAEAFLQVRGRSRFQPVVWTALVEPWRLLARLGDARPGEPQYVVETSGLTIERATAAPTPQDQPTP